ncbi:MAG TPA: hypothetical protein VGG79_00210 [Roseiarcus sp.]|jgi:hypothetical protein
MSGSLGRRSRFFHYIQRVTHQAQDSDPAARLVAEGQWPGETQRAISSRSVNDEALNWIEAVSKLDAPDGQAGGFAHEPRLAGGRATFVEVSAGVFHPTRLNRVLNSQRKDALKN